MAKKTVLAEIHYDDSKRPALSKIDPGCFSGSLLNNKTGKVDGTVTYAPLPKDTALFNAESLKRHDLQKLGQGTAIGVLVTAAIGGISGGIYWLLKKRKNKKSQETVEVNNESLSNSDECPDYSTIYYLNEDEPIVDDGFVSDNMQNSADSDELADCPNLQA